MTRPTASKRRDLGIYRRIYISMWLDSKFRGLSSPEPNAQYLWMYLLCGPSTIAAPGVIRATRGGMADELGWSPVDLQRCFDELQSAGMVEVDWSAGVIWLPKATLYNPPASPNAVKAWAKSLDHITECPLKVVITQRLQEFLHDYGEAFLQPFRELLREPGAGTGTGETPNPFSEGTVPSSSKGTGTDPAPLHGAAGSDPSPSSGESATGMEDGGIDGKDQTDKQADSTGDGEGFELDGGTAPSQESLEAGKPWTPSGGQREPGCTLCGNKASGMLFRQDQQGVVFVCHCWGCAGLKSRNDYKLPVPGKDKRGDWKMFEHAFPDRKKMRKRDRELWIGEVAARTLTMLAGRNDAADARERREAEDRIREENRCDHCGGAPGVLYAENQPGAWIAGLCPECGGSVLLASPPVFMGPGIGKADRNGVWVPMTKTPAADLDEAGRQKFHDAAVARAKALAKAGTAGEVPVGSKSSPDTPETESEPEVTQPDLPSEQWDDAAVSGEPPPI